MIWLMIAFPIGILSALRPRTLLDRAAMVFVLIGVSAHPVWIGLLLSYLVGFKLGLTPLGGYCDMINPSTDCGGPVQWAHSLLLPWVTFALLYAALYTRMIRANVMETMNEDYVRTARAKGAPESRVMRAHILRNAMLPIVTILGMDIGLLLGGAIFTESVFGLPGLGKTAVQSLEGFDLPTVQGIVVFSTLAIIALNLTSICSTRDRPAHQAQLAASFGFPSRSSNARITRLRSAFSCTRSRSSSAAAISCSLRACTPIASSQIFLPLSVGSTSTPRRSSGSRMPSDQPGLLELVEPVGHRAAGEIGELRELAGGAPVRLGRPSAATTAPCTRRAEAVVRERLVERPR